MKARVITLGPWRIETYSTKRWQVLVLLAGADAPVRWTSSEWRDRAVIGWRNRTRDRSVAAAWVYDMQTGGVVECYPAGDLPSARTAISN